MNKFINSPDRLGSLAAVVFWLVAFAACSAAMWAILARLAGIAR
jgi:hypothetical protein